LDAIVNALSKQKNSALDEIVNMADEIARLNRKNFRTTMTAVSKYEVLVFEDLKYFAWLC